MGDRMRRLLAMLQGVEKSESGSVMSEYALVSAVLLVSITAGMALLKTSLGGMFDVIANGLK